MLSNMLSRIRPNMVVVIDVDKNIKFDEIYDN